MRLFIGISIGDSARTALNGASLRMQKCADGRYVESDLYHVTLAFLGDLNEVRLDEIRAAMDESADQVRPIPLALSGPGYFGKPDSAILYAGVRGAEQLRQAADGLRRALTARDLPCDPKPFKPHITLARRVRATRELLGVAVESVKFTADGLTLFHSCRVSGRLRYLPIHFVPFQRGDS